MEVDDRRIGFLHRHGRLHLMHLAVGTPMYGGNCSAAYDHSTNALQNAIRKDGGTLTVIRLGNESLIPRARNTIAWHFLQTDASHLLWCDADQGFRVEDVSRMMAANKPMIVGPVPMKKLNWERIAAAVKAGVPPEQLHRYAGHFNIVPLPGEERSRTEPFRIKWGGTGFMLVEREVFETLAPSTPEYINRLPGDAMPSGVKVKHFFPVDIEGDELLSEDFAFCARWIKAGGEVWCAPWVRVSHMGTFCFEGEYLLCH